jgi:5-methylthioadenosine/S-adenosylhomocysteine deaminase
MTPPAELHVVLTPRWIAPIEPANTVLTDHAVVIRGDLIEAILPCAEALRLYPQARRTDLPDHLLIPGLINLHSHAAMALLRGAGDDLPLERWLHERIWPIEGALMSEEFVYDGAVLACREMLRGGVTTFNDMYFFPQATARAALEMGMRAVLGILVIDYPSAYGSGPADYLNKGMALRDSLRHESSIGFCLAPHAPYSVSDDAFREVVKLAAELQLPVHMHVHETAREITDHVARYGVRPLERLAALGLVGPELIAVHAVHLNDAEIRLLADHGASVAHCPHSNLKLASGIAPVARMLDQGVNLGIGTDGSASNNRLDMLLEMRTASLLAKGSSADATALGAHATLRAATLSAARAIGWQDRIGSIVAGKSADLVAIDLSDDDQQPVYDPVAQLLYSAGREQVTDVWIGGRAVVTKRQLACTRALEALSDISARRVVWHNRLSLLVPDGVQDAHLQVFRPAVN